MTTLYSNPWYVAGSYLGIMLALYFIVGGFAYWLYWKYAIKRWAHNKSQPGMPDREQLQREISYSGISLMIFTLAVLLVWWLTQKGISRVYLDYDDYGTGWFILSIFLMVLMHDAWFYWTHRLMHIKYLYKTMHRLHHLSRNPTPWATYAFHPYEAIVQIAMLPLFTLFLPIHPLAIMIFFVNQHLYNVQGHLGFENLPRWFISAPLARLTNTCTHHNMHHRFFKGNYGLYFNH